MNVIQTDILIVGTGCSGLFAALHAPKDKKVLLICKTTLEESDSFLAQGGICVLKDPSDYESFFKDTIRAGHYKNRRQSVDIMIQSSPDVIAELESYGVRFTKDAQGNFVYTKEGCHSHPRILFHEDITGKEITSHLLKEAKKHKNLTFMENTTMLDILEEDNTCYGIVAKKEEELFAIQSDFTLLATGGIGGLFNNSTNYPHLTGDSLAISLRHHIALENPDYIQIHPTTLYSKKKGRRFLISESVRGEGAKLYDKYGKRFADEVLPRDLLTQKIYQQMKKDDTPFVWLDMTVLGKEQILSHFPHIYQHCLQEGFDCTKEWIPVVPGQHYFMGGIHVDAYSRTTMDQLYAIGETACNGVHGENRLASNSLLESLVFAQRAMKDLSIKTAKTCLNLENLIQTTMKDLDVTKYASMVREVIKKKKEGRKMNSITMSMNVDTLILQALREDVTSEDITTNAIMKGYQSGSVQLICKEDGIIAGLPVFERVFQLVDSKTEVTFFFNDGDHVHKGEVVAEIYGDIRSLLTAERTALNYLQRMSGIATYTRQTADLLKGTGIRLLDTRKTTPNMRVFEKYAVKVGGGYNHRYNLSDGILLKDNHIAAAGGIRQAVELAKEYASFVRKIEVEVENMDMVKEAVEAGADIIMLDNMSIDQMKEAVQYIQGRALTECSGNATKENIAALASTGVDYISSGALTHSSKILDLSLKNLKAV